MISQEPKSKIQDLQNSKIRNPKSSKIQNLPKSKIQNPKSEIQNPKSKIQNPRNKSRQGTTTNADTNNVMNEWIPSGRRRQVAIKWPARRPPLHTWPDRKVTSHATPTSRDSYAKRPLATPLTDYQQHCQWRAT